MNIQMYFMRVVGWRLNQIEPTAKEEEFLDEVSNASIRKYLVWRKTVLSVSMAPVFFAAVMGFLGISGSVGWPFNPFGSIVALLPRFDGLILFFGVCFSRWWWNLPLRTTLLLLILWAISFVMPLVPGLFPIELLLARDALESLTATPENQAWLFGFKVSLAISYAITIVPIIVTFPSSFGRAALRMRGLYPSATSLPGWIMLVAIPFYSLFVFMALVVITQLVGSILLLVATLLMISGPWIMVCQGNLYVNDVSTPKQDKRLKWTQVAVCMVNVCGVFLLAIWALTAQAGGIRVTGNKDDENALLSYGQLIRLGFELVGRLLVTTVVFADVLIQMIAKNWSIEQDRQSKNEPDDSIDESYFQLFGIKGFEQTAGTNLKASGTPTNASEDDEDDDNGVPPDYDVESLSVRSLGAHRPTYDDMEAMSVPSCYGELRAPQPHRDDDDEQV